MAASKSAPVAPTELQIALDNRTFEIQLFGQRSNYFLVLITALGAGVFTLKDQWLALPFSFFAMASSFLWYRTNLGSRFWQESWEAEVSALAKEHNIRSFERPIEEIRQQVESALSGGGRRWFLRRWVDRQILKKPSVTANMIYLSMMCTAVWALVTSVFAWRIAPSLWRFFENLIACSCGTSG